MLDWNHLEPLTQLLLRPLHTAALLFVAVAYTVKIRELLARQRVREGTPARGSHFRGIRYSFSLLLRPWRMESQRRHWFRSVEFALLHLCIAVAIAVACTMPWTHAWLSQPAAVHALEVVFALGTLLGTSRLVRRLASPAMRAISSPDDYFSLLVLTLWMLAGFFAAPQTSERWLTVYFAMATLLLVYLPFSKISHYLYWFFVRYYVGWHFGHRGVYPAMRAPVTAPFIVPVGHVSAGAEIWRAVRRVGAAVLRPLWGSWGRDEAGAEAPELEAPAGGVVQPAGRGS